MDTGCSKETAEGYVRSDFVVDKGAATTVISQAWRGQGRGGGGEGGGLMSVTGEGEALEYLYYRTETGDAQVSGLSCADT